ncbi:MAG: DUF456 domain-containing protein [Cyclobacteriaceae bacterium]|jgi:hypothetical protein|nr:DUF456 domain-containing protein [Cyclobacteriaceae bacterium]
MGFELSLDILWMALGVMCVAVGLLGSFLPVLPGPPLAFVGLWLQQLRDPAPFSTTFLWVWLGVTVVVTVLDYIVPAYGTKKFGGTKYGVWGSTLGLLVGIFAGPLGIIIGPFIGALVGELMANQSSGKAFRAALGSFIGFLVGTVMKLIVCAVMGWYLVASFF